MSFWHLMALLFAFNPLVGAHHPRKRASERPSAQRLEKKSRNGEAVALFLSFDITIGFLSFSGLYQEHELLASHGAPPRL